MTHMMKQVRLHGPRDLRVDEVPLPSLGEADVLIEVAARGVCGSDLGFYESGGIRRDGAPMPLGHEFSGVIRVVGTAVGQSHHQTLNRRTAGNAGRAWVWQPACQRRCSGFAVAAA